MTSGFFFPVAGVGGGVGGIFQYQCGSKLVGVMGLDG